MFSLSKRSVRSVVTVLAILAALTVVVSCKPKKPTTTESVKPAVVETAPKTEVDVTPKSEFVPPKEPEVKSDALPADLKEIGDRYLKDVFFDFDRYDLLEESREALAADGEFLKKYPTIRVTIEGHCDERGTREYNISLGEKRANAAKEYLAALGLEGDRITVISYGKERPFDPGHDEEAWAKNRRAHFVVTAK